MHHVTSVSMIPLVVIVLCYLVFAFQVLSQTRDLSTKKARAMIALIAVFILCASAGYLPQILSYFIDMEGWTAQLFNEVVHWLLALASVALVMTNQAGAIAAALNAPE